MKEYRVLKHCQIGSLTLEKGQIIYIEEFDEHRDYIVIKHYPDKRQPVGKNALNTYVSLDLIEEY